MYLKLREIHCGSYQRITLNGNRIKINLIKHFLHYKMIAQKRSVP